MHLTPALLHIIDEAGEAVLTLTEDVERDDFLRSRLTRREVQRQLGHLAGALGSVPDADRHRMPELDWDGWRAVRLQLDGTAPPGGLDDAVWFAVRSLVPATLSWLRVYRQG